MLKVNYSNLTNKTYAQICKEAKRRGINVYDYSNREDVIGAIIAHDAFYEGRDKAMEGYSPKPTNEKRIAYHLENEYNGKEYYIKITEEQQRFLLWCEENEIDFPNTEVTEISTKEWEEP